MKLLQIDPNYVVEWTTDTDYCHHGMPLSNGIFGALVWFERNTLMLTVNRADYWEHRGGIEWTDACTYANVAELLQKGDFDEVRRLFASKKVNGKEKPPTRLPMGRIEIKLKPDVRVEAASLDLKHAEALIRCAHPGGQGLIKAAVLMDSPVLALSLEPDWVESVTLRPAYDFPKVKSYFDTYGIPAYRNVEEGTLLGWVQELPEDPQCAVLLKPDRTGYRIAAYHETGALLKARETLEELQGQNYEHATDSTRKAWHGLWTRTADIRLADSKLADMYYLGIYKMLGNSMPGKIAPTLQGPWVEEHQLPAWKSDYHFNINVQECLWPSYASNHLDALKPLFEMIDRWKPLLAARARTFAGTDEGYYLPHSTDDRGTICGAFWTGTMDYACTSWMAQMMWQYARYAGDDDFMLREVYPFMKRTLNLFRATMEWDGTRYRLPVTVSPEYGGTADDAWGANSTFFLVNVHFLCDKLSWIHEAFGLSDPDLQKVRHIAENLPRYSSGEGPFGEELHIWEGQPLAESHRHHSHLAGIFPFETMNPDDEAWKPILRSSYRRWVQTGMGYWTGWSMPWASILHGRMGSKDMAYQCLKLFEEVFVDKGYATRHNGKYEGFTRYVGGDIMQSECGIAYSAAVLDMFVQSANGLLRVFPSLPDRFGDAAFAGIRTDGAFLVSAGRTGGKLEEIRIFSEKGSRLRLDNPFVTAEVQYADKVRSCGERVIELDTEAGQTIVVRQRQE